MTQVIQISIETLCDADKRLTFTEQEEIVASYVDVEMAKELDYGRSRY